MRDGLRVGEYTPGRYTFWGVFSSSPLFLYPQFSSNSPSILFQDLDFLHVWRLQDPPTKPKKCFDYITTSRSGRRMAAVGRSENTITILDLHSQAPPQFIDTGVVIAGLVITGDVLLVQGSGKVVAWLLTEEGTVDGVLDNERAGPSDSIWTTSLNRSSPHERLGIEGQVGIFKTGDTFPFTHHIMTGDVLGLARKPEDFSRHWIPISSSYDYQKSLPVPHHDPTLNDTFPKSIGNFRSQNFRRLGG